ncbi:MAG: ATP-binding protein [Thermoanaerobaculia bacterium]
MSTEESRPRAARTSSETAISTGEGWWRPGRSLTARLVWILLPLAFIPVSVYWLLADRESARSEKEIVAILLQKATERERTLLKSAADARAHELEDRAEGITQILAEAVAVAAGALAAPPSGDAPGEPLQTFPGGFLGSRAGRPSSAIVMPVFATSPAALRSVAASRAIEGPFLTFLAGESGVVSLFVITTSGVIRAVPAGDVPRLVREGGFPADFRAPTQQATALLSPGTRPDAVVWSRLYTDLYRGAGTLATAVRFVRDRDGRLLGEVGADWAIEKLLESGQVGPTSDHVEILLSPPDQKVIVHPARGLSQNELATILGLAARGGEGEFEVPFEGQAHLLALRRLRGLPWVYARHTSLTSIRSQTEAQAGAVFAADRRARNRLRYFYLGLVTLYAGVALFVVARAMAPVRRAARFADAIAAGREVPELGSMQRRDEVGRLVSALRALEGRVRRRISTMERTHQLAGTASVMTSPEETFARLTRLVADGVGASKCWLALWEPETRSLALVPPAWGVPEAALRGRRLALSDPSLAVKSYQTGETYVLNDLFAEPRVSLLLLDELGVSRNVAFAPLRTEAGSLGVLSVADKPGGFDADDRAALESFADQAALLLRNSRLYEEVQKSYERLRDAQRKRDHFLQNVNHELRTPLTAILGWSEILAEDRPDSETSITAMAQIRRSAQFLLVLISDLLDLSRYEEGKAKLEAVETDLASVVGEAVEPVSVMAEGKGILLAVDAPTPGKVIVHLDPVRMRQVLWNLLHNAVKFTPRGGRIDLSARAGEDGVDLVVKDTGAGIEPTDLPHVFDRFRQGDGKTERVSRGMGIGLSLVKAFVEMHGGTVRAESQLGRGAIFRVHIPKLPVPAPTN